MMNIPKITEKKSDSFRVVKMYISLFYFLIFLASSKFPVMDYVSVS